MTLFSGAKLIVGKRYFAPRIERAAAGKRALCEKKKCVVADQCWWTLDEIVVSFVTLWPAGLKEMLELCAEIDRVWLARRFKKQSSSPARSAA